MLKLRSMAPFLACFLLGLPGQAKEPRPAHLRAKVTCHDCHGEETPTRAVTDESCIACHGDMPAMAAYTKGLAVNPHAIPKGGHPALPACTQCHLQHQPPVVTCLACHSKFKLTPK